MLALGANLACTTPHSSATPMAPCRPGASGMGSASTPSTPQQWQDSGLGRTPAWPSLSPAAAAATPGGGVSLSQSTRDRLETQRQLQDDLTGELLDMTQELKAGAVAMQNAIRCVVLSAEADMLRAGVRSRERMRALACSAMCAACRCICTLPQ